MYLLQEAGPLIGKLPSLAKREGSQVKQGLLVSQTSSSSPPNSASDFKPPCVTTSSQYSCSLWSSLMTTSWILSRLLRQGSRLNYRIPITVNDLDGRFLARITHRTAPLLLILSGNHRKQIELNLISSLCMLLVLGHSWLQNPQIDWSAGKITN